MNKYLEKIALFGFSNSEKRSKIYAKHYIATNNLYAKHASAELDSINKRHSTLETTKHRKAYVNDLETTMKSHKALHSEYEPIHTKFKAGIEKVGGSDKNWHMDDFIHMTANSHRAGFDIK
jgi:hypothetical protein